MQRRHFELIASVIRDLDMTDDSSVVGELRRKEIAREFAGVLRTTNAAFDSERFLKACQPIDMADYA